MSRRKNQKLDKNQEVGSIKNQIVGRNGIEQDYVTVRIFCLLSRRSQKQDKKPEV